MTSAIDAAPAKPAFRLTRGIAGARTRRRPRVADRRLGSVCPQRCSAAGAAAGAERGAACARRLGVRLRRDHADLFRALAARRARQRASRIRRLCAGEPARHPCRRRHRLVAPVRENAGADAADAASDSAGVLDSARHHLVRHRRQAGDLPGLPRRVLSRPDEHHSRREDGRSQSRACRRDDGREPAADADRYRASRGIAVDFLRACASRSDRPGC